MIECVSLILKLLVYSVSSLMYREIPMLYTGVLFTQRTCWAVNV